MFQPQSSPAIPTSDMAVTDGPTAASGAAQHLLPVVRVEFPFMKVTFWTFMITLAAGALVSIGVLLSWIINKRDVVKQDSVDLKANLQDVSSLFTYHLTAIGIIVGLASVAAVGLQILFQIFEAKKNQQLRDQEKRRAESMDAVIKSTGDLIQNMAALTKTTQAAMDNTNRLSGIIEKHDKGRQSSLDELARVSRDGLASISITRGSFRKDIQSVFTLARTSAMGVARADHPAEFLILDALYQGGHTGNSQAALSILLNIDSAKLSALDRPNQARYHYFCAHFSLRVGKQSEAVKHFLEGQNLTAHPTGYRLYAAIAKLFDLRQNGDKSPFEEAEVVSELEAAWKGRQSLSTRDQLGSMDPKVFWEQLGHTYAAVLVEGVFTSDGLPVGSAARQKLCRDVKLGREVAIEANREYRELAGADNGALDAVLYEAGLILCALGEEQEPMTVEKLKSAILGCGIKLATSDLREQIVYATRHARFHGRLAAAYMRAGNEDQAAKHESEMEESKEKVLGLVQAFKDEWVSGERLYSVFTNGYELPNTLAEAICADVNVDNYSRLLDEACTQAAAKLPAEPEKSEFDRFETAVSASANGSERKQGRAEPVVAPNGSEAGG